MSAQSILSAKIPFSFKIGSEDFGPGGYVFTARDGRIEIRNTDKSGKTAIAMFETRLGSRREAGLVFDKDGQQLHLSELYIPGSDGYYFKCFAGATHTHEVIPAEKK